MQPWLSAKTLPAVQSTSNADRVRASSRERYGTAREQIDRDLQDLIIDRRPGGGDDLAPRPLDNGGPS